MSPLYNSIIPLGGIMRWGRFRGILPQTGQQPLHPKEPNTKLLGDIEVGVVEIEGGDHQCQTGCGEPVIPRQEERSRIPQQVAECGACRQTSLFIPSGRISGSAELPEMW